jgi:hypothetical protein
VGIDCLKGRICTRVYEHYPQNFTFGFGEASLAVDCLWRIKVDGRVALTSRDHSQKFGLPAPVDAHADASSRLKGHRVVEARLDERSADVIVEPFMAWLGETFPRLSTVRYEPRVSVAWDGKQIQYYSHEKRFYNP